MNDGGKQLVCCRMHLFLLFAGVHQSGANHSSGLSFITMIRGARRRVRMSPDRQPREPLRREIVEKDALLIFRAS